ARRTSAGTGRSLRREAARPSPPAPPRSTRRRVAPPPGSRYDADRHPLAAHEVGHGGRFGEHLAERRAVVRVVLKGDLPAGRDLAEDAADDAEAVLAAVAGDGDPRLAPNLRRAVEDRRVGDVGKVGQDHVDVLLEQGVGEALLDRDIEFDAEALGVL